MKLPIELIPGTNPPRFRWQQLVDTPVGRKLVESEGVLPPSIEDAVVALVKMVEHLAAENTKLKQGISLQEKQVAMKKTDK